ncbi:MAG: hypothetical protein KDG54_03900 [Geminicoccaceae bacterium]|nr:hypothetical protein [Geminicoccaceae bacterium]
MRKTIVIGAVEAACLSSAGHASMTVDEYLRVEEGKMENIDPALNVVYVWGVMDALGVFDDALRENLGQTLFCVPPDAPALVVEGFKEKIDQAIEDARKSVIDFDAYKQEMTIGGVGLQVLSEIYSCHKE